MVVSRIHSVVIDFIYRYQLTGFLATCPVRFEPIRQTATSCYPDPSWQLPVGSFLPKSSGFFDDRVSIRIFLEQYQDAEGQGLSK